MTGGQRSKKYLGDFVFYPLTWDFPFVLISPEGRLSTHKPDAIRHAAAPQQSKKAGLRYEIGYTDPKYASRNRNASGPGFPSPMGLPLIDVTGVTIAVAAE